jgi:glycosyltransferase EpsF
MKKRILHVISSLSAGGIESLVVSLYENIDRDKFQFDLAVFNPNNQIHRTKLEELEANIHFIANAGSKTSILSKIIWRIAALYNFGKLISKNHYDVLHCHNYSNYGPYVLLAALKGIPIRIVHSHTGGGLKDSYIHKFQRKVIKLINFNRFVTTKIGCSNTASKWLFGTNTSGNAVMKIIYNGIDMDKFASASLKEKQHIRHLYEMEDGVHFVHVARFTEAKNELFLVELFYEMTKSKNNLYLNFIGYGPFEEKIKILVNTFKINNRVRFFGLDSDIPQLMVAMDYFLLPSLWEGFPITALEAQAAGIPIFISDTVTKEVDMGLATFLPINKGPKYWADYILKVVESKAIPVHIDMEKKMKYDIKNIAKQFEEIYLK